MPLQGSTCSQSQHHQAVEMQHHHEEILRSKEYQHLVGHIEAGHQDEAQNEEGTILDEDADSNVPQVRTVLAEEQARESPG